MPPTAAPVRLSVAPTYSPTVNLVGNTDNVQWQYTYILVIGVFGAFGFGFGTGANDVANAFGTSVGSGALSNRSAMFIASVFEFLGALVLGRVSTDTIAGKIAIPAAFNPYGKEVDPSGRNGNYYCSDQRICGKQARARRCKNVCASATYLDESSGFWMTVPRDATATPTSYWSKTNTDGTPNTDCPGSSYLGRPTLLTFTSGYRFGCQPFMSGDDLEKLPTPVTRDNSCSMPNSFGQNYRGADLCLTNDHPGEVFFGPGNPMAFAYGMMWVLIVGTVWLLIATLWGYNVSSTHSIIGGIIGFALSYDRNAVNWIYYEDDKAIVAGAANDKSGFPFSGVVPIVVTWFFAPCATATCASCMYLVIRTIVLRSEHSFSRSFWLLPIFVFLTMFICIYFVFTKGAAKTFNADSASAWDDSKSGWVSVVIAAGCAIIALCLLPCMKSRVESMIEVEVAQNSAFERRKKAKRLEKKMLELEENTLNPLEKLPAGWMAGPDATTGKIYYLNTSLGVTQWEAPVYDRKASMVRASLLVHGPRASHTDGHPSVPGMAGPMPDEYGNMPVQAASVDVGKNPLNSTESGLPSGWEEHKDPATSKLYWHNTATGVTQWTKPAGLPAGWEEHKDPSTGKVYWANAATGESSWTLPGDADAEGEFDVEATRIANIEAAYLRSPRGWQLCQEDCNNPQVGCCRTLLSCNERSMEQDRQFMHEAVLDIEDIAGVEENAEQFDQRTEASFKILQIFSACCVMFAHGSGEVGYMAGPLSTIWVAYNNKASQPLPEKGAAEYWVLVLAAASLVCGLAIFGKRVTRVVGKEMAKISAARGFSAELSTAIVIMVAAQYGLPTSSSQCITGGIVGIGITEGVKKGVNWKQFGFQFLSWVNTIFIMALGVAAIFKQGLEAPQRYVLRNTQYDCGNNAKGEAILCKN